MENVTLENRCVIDGSGIYQTFVTLRTEQNTDGYTTESVLAYKLKNGEKLLNSLPPTKKAYKNGVGFIIPCWDENASTWKESATEEEIAAWEAEHPDPNAKTLEELRTDKEAELSAACNAAIVAGMDVETSHGTEHFSLQETDQINLTTAYNAVVAGAGSYPYHADGKLCRMFTAEEITAISNASIAHKLYHTTLCNHLLTWTRRAETKEKLQGITYSADNLPEDLAANMAQVLAAASAAMPV